MGPNDVEGTWGEYRRLVLKEIESLHGEVEKLERLTNELQRAVTEIKVRVALISAGIAAGASIIVTWLVNNIRLG